MPPWKPEPGWAAYRDERRLTPDADRADPAVGGRRDAARRRLQGAATARLQRRLAARHARPGSRDARRVRCRRGRPRHLPQLRAAHRPHRRQVGEGDRAEALGAQPWCTTCCSRPTPPAARAPQDGARWPARIPGSRLGLHDPGGGRPARRAERRSRRLGPRDDAVVSAGGSRCRCPRTPTSFCRRTSIRTAPRRPRRPSSASTSDRSPTARCHAVPGPGVLRHPRRHRHPGGREGLQGPRIVHAPGRCGRGERRRPRPLSRQGSEVHRHAARPAKCRSCSGSASGTSAGRTNTPSRIFCRCRKARASTAN